MLSDKVIPRKLNDCTSAILVPFIVIHKKLLFTRFFQIIDDNTEQQRAQNGSLWDTSCNLSKIKFMFIKNDILFPVCR